MRDLHLIVVQILLHETEIEISACPSSEDIQNVRTGRLEVRRRVERFRDEDLAVGPVVRWSIQIGHCDESETENQ